MKLGIHIFRVSMAAILLALVMSVGTASAQQASGSDPTAMSVQEQQLFQELNKLQGRITIPDQKLAVLEQPQGRDYRGFHERALPWIGGIIIIGMIVILAAFYFYRGRIRVPAGEGNGRTIQRFTAFERFNHWMTATCFVVLAITGLNYFFGKRLLMPMLGPDAFSDWSQWAKYAHNFLAWPFMLGVLIMIIVWVRDNIPDRYDVAWLKAGGGLFGKTEPDAERFNAGQKLIFWAVVIFGIALAVTGIVMLFPFTVAGVNGMQLTQYVHSIVGVVFIAIILAHIYIGTLGMEGAFEGMWSGKVDLSWARYHHRLWVEKLQAKTRRGPEVGRGSASAPAE